MSSRSKSLFLVLIAAAWSAAAQQPSCEGANAAAVKVVLDGCGGFEPEGRFTVEYGTEPITVDPKTGYWLWTAPNDDMKFKIGTRPLHIPPESIPRALAKCKTTASAVRDGACMAVYVVKCEPLWFVKVGMVPKGDPPSLTYERRGNARTIDACPREDPPLGPGQVNLANSESLLVKIDRPKCQIPLGRNSFPRGREELTLADVPVNAVSEGAAIAQSTANDEVAKKALQKKVKEMRFSTKE